MRTTLHKFICLILAFTMLLTAAGCTQTSHTETDPEITTTPTQTDPDPNTPDVTDPDVPDQTEPPDQPIISTDPSNPEHTHMHYKKKTAPTCTEDGYTTCSCECGDSYVIDPTTALGHDLGEGVVIKEPAELTAGVEERTCKRCGEVESILIANYKRSYWDDTKTYATGVLEYNYDLIPDYMLDSKILRALEFTGYDVQFLKDQKLLYHPDYTGIFLEENQGSMREEPILSGITYSNRGKLGSSTKKASTPEEHALSVTGRVPNIAAHKEHGMSCTSFVEYFYFAYLPHCEGVNVSAVLNMHSTANSRFGKGTYTYPDMWTEIMEGEGGLISQGLATHYEISLSDSKNHTEAYNDVWRKLTPGAIIRFRNDTNLYVHFAMYAGTYNNLHYIIHVGNNRGPEILIVEAMGAETSSDPSWPVEFYDLKIDTYDSGAIQIVKSDSSSGTKLKGASYIATNNATGTQYRIGATTEEGYTIVEGLPFGTYTIQEVTAADGYVKDSNTYTVTLSQKSPFTTLLLTSDA